MVADFAVFLFFFPFSFFLPFFFGQNDQKEKLTIKERARGSTLCHRLNNRDIGKISGLELKTIIIKLLAMYLKK